MRLDNNQSYHKANPCHSFELFLLSDGEKKITETIFTGKRAILNICITLAGLKHNLGMSNTSDFIMNKEDHTLGNLIAEYLKQAPHVMMAGYKSSRNTAILIVLISLTLPFSCPS